MRAPPASPPHRPAAASVRRSVSSSACVQGTQHWPAGRKGARPPRDRHRTSIASCRAASRARDAERDRCHARQTQRPAPAAPSAMAASDAASRCARASPNPEAAAANAISTAATPCAVRRRPASSRCGSRSSITPGGSPRNPVAAISRRSAASRASSPLSRRAAAAAASNSPRSRCARSPTSLPEARAVPCCRRIAATPAAISSRRLRIGRSRSTAASQREAAPARAGPGLGELAAERGDLRFGVQRELRIRGARIDGCRVDPGLAHQLGQARAPAGGVGEPARRCGRVRRPSSGRSRRRAWRRDR